MKKHRILLFIIFQLTIAACNSTKKEPITEPADEVTIEQELQKDSLFAILANQDTLIMTEDEGTISLERSGSASCTMEFFHDQYSDVIFPRLAVAVINKEGSYETMPYYINEEGILFLPLIGVRYKLTSYFIDTNNCLQLDGITGIRTTLPYLWMNPEKNTFLATQRGGLTEDGKWPYDFLVYKMEEEGISQIGNHFFEIDSLIEVKIQMQASLAAAILFHLRN